MTGTLRRRAVVLIVAFAVLAVVVGLYLSGGPAHLAGTNWDGLVTGHNWGVVTASTSWDNVLPA